MAKIDLTGNVYFRWTVLSHYGENKRRQSMWLCRCECGNDRVIAGHSLTRGGTKSCGCWNSERSKIDHTVHGQSCRGSMTQEYRAWEEMKKRCTNPNRKFYKDYGGRGIKVYAPWFDSFDAFYAYVGPKPSSDHSLDRYPNNDGNYEPGNVRWGTDEQQRRNKRNNRWVEFDGERKIASDWARLFNLKTVSSFISYLEKHGVENTFKHYKRRVTKA